MKNFDLLAVALIALGLAAGCSSGRPVGAVHAAAGLDSDGDTVDDRLDRCPATKPCAYHVTGPDGCPVAFTLDLGGVTFDPDAEKLTDASRIRLDRSVAVMQCWTSVEVDIAGHAETCEHDPTSLSMRRATSVYRYLISKGIPESRIDNVHGYGDAEPLTSPIHCGNAVNRRVELLYSD